MQRHEEMEEFVREALAAGAEIDRTGELELYRAEDVHEYLERLARGEKAPPPEPWQP
jgi:hypothetical protein